MDSEGPGVAVDEAAAGAGRVRLEAARSEQDPDAFGAQGLDDAAERGTGGEGDLLRAAPCQPWLISISIVPQ
jgi:hypothetical protein